MYSAYANAIVGYISNALSLCKAPLGKTKVQLLLPKLNIT